ncbi:hypothetical protein Btru_044076 [Bulinus truncatus]|nr:hypothetical protein Btru_044076 [Bulinus truncatus]
MCCNVQLAEIRAVSRNTCIFTTRWPSVIALVVMALIANNVLVEALDPICTLPMDPGTCSVFSKMYYYTPSTGFCQPFKYRGYGGNANRFPTSMARHQCGHLAKDNGQNKRRKLMGLNRARA